MIMKYKGPAFPGGIFCLYRPFLISDCRLQCRYR